MATMTSARVPNEIYEQGVARLAETGSSVTDLIVSAFAYVAATGALPAAQQKRTAAKISPDLLDDLRAKLEQSTLSINLPDDWDYRDELARGLEADYEALS